VDLSKVIADPLGLIGYALALVFGVSKIKPSWKFALAAACVVGGFVLAYEHQSKPTADAAATSKASTTSVQTGPIKQTGNGNAAGVVGNVTVQAPDKSNKK
jgi:hypothetical protein